MNKNLFLKEMKNNALSLGLWMFVIILLISVTMSVFPTFIENQSKVLGMMNLIPKEALQFKGISNFDDLFSVLGFYTANNTIYMMLLGSIFAIVLSSGILLKEEYQKTAEYLLTKPLTRSEVFFSKLIVVIIHIVVLNIVTSLTGYIAIKIVNTGPFSTKAFLILSFYTLLLNLFFGSVGLFLSNLVKRAKPITTFSIGLVLTFYFIFTFSKITPSASKKGYLSPFKYVNVNVTNKAYKLEYTDIWFFIGFILLFTVLSYRIYKRRDIYL